MLLNNGGVKALIKNQTIKNGIEESVEGQKYDFRLGDRFLKAKFARTAKISELDVEQRKDAIIEPGETVFVMTEEVLNLPQDIRLRLSPKRKIGHEGIIILGGLDVDPGYLGPLFIGMYNFSSQPFILQSGKKLIAGIFEKLEKPIKYVPTSMPDDEFPEELIGLIKKYQPISIQGIAEDLSSVKANLAEMQKQLNDDTQWRKDIRTSIKDLVESLKEEVIARKADTASIREKDIALLNQHNSLKTNLNWNWIVILVGIIGTVIGIGGIVFGFIK